MLVEIRFSIFICKLLVLFAVGTNPFWCKNISFYGVCKPMCFTTQVGKWKRAVSLTAQFLPIKRLPPPILTMLLFRRFWVCALVLGPQFLRYKTLPPPILRGPVFLCFCGVHPWHQNAGTFVTCSLHFSRLHFSWLAFFMASGLLGAPCPSLLHFSTLLIPNYLA